MWNKIKEFFEQKAVIIIEGIIIALASAGLIFGGFNATEVATKIAAAVGGIIVAVEALITIIQGLLKK